MVSSLSDSSTLSGSGSPVPAALGKRPFDVNKHEHPLCPCNHMCFIVLFFFHNNIHAVTLNYRQYPHDRSPRLVRHHPVNLISSAQLAFSLLEPTSLTAASTVHMRFPHYAMNAETAIRR